MAQSKDHILQLLHKLPIFIQKWSLKLSIPHQKKCSSSINLNENVCWSKKSHTYLINFYFLPQKKFCGLFSHIFVCACLSVWEIYTKKTHKRKTSTRRRQCWRRSCFTIKLLLLLFSFLFLFWKKGVTFFVAMSRDVTLKVSSWHFTLWNSIWVIWRVLFSWGLVIMEAIKLSLIDCSRFYLLC